MSEEPLTAAQCDELERAMREDAAPLPPESPVKEALLRMAEGYRLLGDLKNQYFDACTDQDEVRG